MNDTTDSIKSIDLDAIAPYLLSGGAGAIAGGVMTGAKKDEDETRGAYLRRLLTNAALGGTLAAGSHAALKTGWDATTSSPMTTNATDENGQPIDSPAKAKLKSALGSKSAGGIGALALLGVASKVRGLRSDAHLIPDRRESLHAKLSPKGSAANKKGLRSLSEANIRGRSMGPMTLDETRRMKEEMHDAKKTLDAAKKMSISDLQDATAHDIGKIEAVLSDEQRIKFQQQRRLAGLPSDYTGSGKHSTLKGVVSHLMRKNLSTLGQSGGVRSRRAAVALTGLLVPATISQFLPE